MLAQTNQLALDPIQVAGLEVILPDNLKAFFCESGYLPTTAEEARTNARLRVRSIGDILMMHTPSMLRLGLTERSRRAGKVLIKDLSRTGIGVLYHQQIYPAEQFQVRFQGRLINAAAVRCRRLGDKCYETGARIVSLEKLEEVGGF
ncbi:MAG: hypothetical protein IT422_20605 [Pirellulaceae bacterium]|jgi:hypothetical protein|nr:hypothetical protein [Pirellulaceae bacterium]